MYSASKYIFREMKFEFSAYNNKKKDVQLYKTLIPFHMRQECEKFIGFDNLTFYKLQLLIKNYVRISHVIIWKFDIQSALSKSLPKLIRSFNYRNYGRKHKTEKIVILKI